MAINTAHTQRLGKVASYLKNVGKSVGYATIEVMKGTNPSMAEFADTNRELFKEVYSATVNYKQTLKKAEVSIKRSKLYTAADTGLKALKEDLKTGQFYNKKRESELELASMGEDFDDLDFDNFDFGDIGGDDDDHESEDHTEFIAGQKADNVRTEFMAKANDRSIMAGAKLTSTTVANSAEFLAATSRANTRLMYIQNQNMIETMGTGFTSLKMGIDAIVNGLSGPLKTHMENSKTFYETTTKIHQENNAILKEILEMQRNLYKAKDEEYKRSAYDDIVGSEGTPDLREYAKQLKKNMKSVLGPEMETLFGNSLGENSNLLMAFVGSPLKFLPVMLMQTVIPATVRTAMKSLDEGFSTLFTNFITRMNKMKKSESPLFSTLGKLFGLNIESKKSVDPSKFERGNMSWNGIAQKTLVDVIPGYLRKIEAHLSGGEENIFDYGTGRWKKASRVKKEYDDIRKGAINSATGDLQEVLIDAVKKLQVDSFAQQKSMLDQIQKFMAKLYDEGGGLRFTSKKADAESLDDTYRDLFSDDKFADYIFKVIAKNKSIARRLDENIINARQSEARQKRDIETYGGTAINLFNDSLDFKHDKKYGKIKNPGLVDKSGHDALFYLRNILGELMYQREHGVKTVGGGTGGSGKGRRRRGRGPSPAPVPAPETVDIDKYVTGKIGKASYLTKEEQEERKAKEKEENAYKGGWFDPDAGYADSHYRAVLAHTKAKKTDDEEKDTALAKWLQKKLNDRKERLNANGDPFLEQLLQAGSIGQKWKVIQDGIAKLTMKPASFLSGVLVKADEQLFNLMFNTKALDPDADLKNKDGKKVKGLVDYMITRTKDAFDKLNDYIDEHILDPLKKKFAPLWEKLKEKAKPYGKAIKEKFKWAGGKVKGAMGKAYGPLWNKAKNSEVVQRLKNGEVMTDEQIAEAQYRHNIAAQTQDPLQAFYDPDVLPEQAQVDEDEQKYFDQYSFMENSARGRYVRHTGLTMVSPGEMIIPASFNKKVQNRQLRNENRMKSRISKMLFSRNIGNHAEGTVDNPNDNPPDSKASKKFTDTALSVASNVTGASPEKVKQIISTVDEEAPDVVASGALGGALGLLVGSPLLGAAAGVATSIVGKSKTLQGILFGSDEQDDGLFSKDLQERFKAVSGDLETYGIAGAVTGMITPLGPVAGLAVGSAVALAKNNVQFMAKLFGKLKDDGTRDETGLIKPNTVDSLKKAAPKMIGGAAAGMMLGPFGLLGNLLLGSGLGFASTTDKFKDLLLGKENEDGDREGGLAGIIRRSVVEPLKASMKTFKEEGIEFFKKNVLAPLRDFVDPFTQMVKNTIRGIGEKVSDTLNSIFERTIGVPLHEAFENILKRITGGVTKLVKGLLFVPKAMISAPFKALGGIGNTIRNSQINRGTASDMTAADRLAFRQKHRFRNRFSKWTGADKTYELDSMMAHMSDDRTSALYDLVGQYVDQGKWSDTRRRDEINGAGDALVTYLNENKDDKGKSLMDSIGFKASKDIRRAIASGDTEIFRKTLANTKGLSITHQNAIFDQLMQSVGAINNYSNMRNLGAKKRSELEKDISKITGTKINSKMIKNLYRNLKTEVKANKEKKAAEEKEDKDGIKRPNFDSPDMAKLSDVLQANANKTADRLIETFSVTNKLLKVIAEHEVGKVDFDLGNDKESIKLGKEIYKSDLKIGDLSDKKSNIRRGFKADAKANFGSTVKNNKISYLLTNAFGNYNGTIKDFTALPNGRINQVLYLKNSIDGSAVEFMLTLDQSEFDNYAKIAKAIYFKLTSTDCDNIRDNLTKTGANLILKVSKTGYRIKDIKSLIEIMNNIKSNDQIRLIKNYIRTTGIVPETAHDLIEASKPSSIPSGSIKKKRKRKDKPAASSLTGSMNNVEKDQQETQEMSPDEGGGNAAVNAAGGLRASRSVVNKTADVINKTETSSGTSTEMSPHGHRVTFGSNGEPLDDKSSQLGMKDFKETQEREEELADATKENTTGFKTLLSRLFGKSKPDGEEKKEGFLSKALGSGSFVGKGVGKLLKYLGMGATALVGVSLTGHLSQYWKETVWPSLQENVIPKLAGMIIGTEDENGLLKGGLRGFLLGNKDENGEWDGTGVFPTLGAKIESVGEKITGTIQGIIDWYKGGGLGDLFTNNLIPKFLDGFKYFNENLLAPITATIIRALPSIAVGIVKGIKSVFSVGLFNRKLKDKKISIDVSDSVKDANAIAENSSTRAKVAGWLDNISSPQATAKDTYEVDLSDVEGDDNERSMDTNSGENSEENGGGGVIGKLKDFFGWNKSTNTVTYDEDHNRTSDYYAKSSDTTIAGQIAHGAKNAFLAGAGGIQTSGLASALANIGLKDAAKGAISGAVKGNGIVGKAAGAVPGVIKGIGSTAGKVISGAKSLGDRFYNTFTSGADSTFDDVGNAYLRNFGDDAAEAAANASKNDGLLAKVGKMVTEFFGKFAKDSKVLGVFSKAAKWAFGKNLGETVLVKAMNSLSTKLVEAIGKNVASTALTKLATNLASVTPFGIGILIAQFLSGINNAETIFGVTQPLGWGYKFAAGIINVINNKITFGLVPTSTIVDLVMEYILPLFGIDDTELQKQRDNAYKELDEWNSTHDEDEQYDNIEDFNNKDKITTKVSNYLFGKKNKDGKREGGLVGSAKKWFSDGWTQFKKRREENQKNREAAQPNVDAAIDKIVDIADSGNPTLDAINAVQVDPTGDEAIDTVANALFADQKLAVMPYALSRVAWKNIKNFFGKVAYGFKNLGSSFVTGISNMWKSAMAGDAEGFWMAGSENINDSEGGLSLSGILGDVLTNAVKFISYPITGSVLVFNQIKNLISRTIDATKSVIPNVKNGLAASWNAISTSNSPASEVFTSTIQKTGDGLADGIGAALYGVAKLPLLVPALLKSGVNYIKEKFTAITSALKKFASSSMDASDSRKIKEAQEGKLSIFDSNYWKGADYSSAGVLSPVLTVSTMMTKLINAPIALVKSMFQKVGDTIGNIKDFIGDKVSSAVDWFKGFFGGGSSDDSSGTGRSGAGRRRGSGGARVYQEDPSIADMKFGDGSVNNTIGDAGCGPVAATNLINSLGGNMDVSSAANYAVRNGFKEKNGGTNMDYFNAILGSNGYSTSNSRNANDVRDSLRQGKQVVMLGNDGTQNGPFGDKNHFITAKGYDENGNIVVDDPYNPNGNLKYSAGQVLSHMQDSVIVDGYGRGMGRRSRAMSAFGKLSDADKKILIKKLAVITGGAESGGDYSSVLANDCGAYSVGLQQLHGVGKAGRFFKLLANDLTGSDKQTALNFANMASRPLSTSEANQMKNFLNKSNVKPLSIKYQDQLNEEFMSGNISTAIKMYEAGELLDPRSIVLIGDIANTGPAYVDKWRKVYKPASSKSADLENVRKSLTTQSYWATSTSQRQYVKGWINRINNTYNILKNWDGKTVDGASLSSGSSSSSSSSDSSSSKSSTIFSQLADLGKSVLKGVYGEDVYNAFFGSDTSSSSDDSSDSSDGTSYTGDAKNGSLEKFVQVALNEEGYKEKRSNSQLESKTANAGSANWTKYGPLTNNPHDAWCASFVSWVANQAGIPASVIPRSAYVGTFTDFYKKQNRWKSKGATPKRGDIVTFGSSGDQHIGIVTGVKDGQVKTIEGNTSNMVAQRSYSIKGSNNIYGYGTPNAAAATGTSGQDGTTATTNALGRRRRSGFGPSNLYENNDQKLKRDKIPNMFVSDEVKYRNGQYIAHTARATGGRGRRGNGGAGSGSIDYTQVLASIVNVLLSISNNTEVLNKIMTILSEKLGVSVSSNDVQSVAKSAADTADAKAKLTQLLNNQKTTSSGVTSLLNNSSTEYLVKAMEAIAAQ